MKKRLCSLILALALTAALAAPAFGADTDVLQVQDAAGGALGTYSDLAVAIDNVPANGTVKLLADCPVSTLLLYLLGDTHFTLDLNGFAITFDGAASTPPLLPGIGALLSARPMTITGNGRINGFVAAWEDLTVENGTFKGVQALTEKHVTIKTGTFLGFTDGEFAQLEENVGEYQSSDSFIAEEVASLMSMFGTNGLSLLRRGSEDAAPAMAAAAAILAPGSSANTSIVPLYDAEGMVIGAAYPQNTVITDAPPVVAIPMYWPTVNQVPGGSLKASPLAGSEGATMNLLVKTASGMVLEQLIVTDAEGQRVAAWPSGENRWSFVQPASKVTVTPVFVHADPLEGFAKTDPAAPATRGDLAQLLWRMEGKPVVNYLMQFSDVQENEAIRWAASQKLMQGHGDGTFRPDEAITRQEAATVLYRWTQSRGGGFTGMWMFLLQHPDRMDVAEWAYEAICWVTMHEILDCSEGMILPEGEISRADLAEMVNKME